MKNIGQLICLATALQSVTIGFSALGDTVVPQPQYGYTVTLPQGWTQIPTDVIDRQMRALNDVTGAKMPQKFVDGFQPAGRPWFQYPYILVQAKETGPISEEQLRTMKSFQSGLQKGLDETKKKLSSVISESSLGETVYDPSNKCVWISFSMNAVNVGAIKAVTCGFLTRKGMVAFNCYARTADFDQRLAEFNSILATVRISDDMQYQPGLGRRGFDLSQVMRSGLIGGMAGAVIGLVMWLMKKKKSAGGPTAA